MQDLVEFNKSPPSVFSQETGPRAFRDHQHPWNILSPLYTRDAAVALRELEGGANGLILCHIDAVAALADLPLHALSIRNAAGGPAALDLSLRVSKLPLDPARLRISFGLRDCALLPRLLDAGFQGPFFEAMEQQDAVTSSEKLASVLKGIVQHWRSATVLSREQLSLAVTVTLTADENMFATLAKFRSMRLLWGKLLNDFHLPFCGLNLHGTTAPQLLCAEHHENYMLQTTAATFGAGLGGASSFTIEPFHDAIFERRMARNIQNILQHESRLWAVQDPAAGAGLVETSTRMFCEEAWDIFQKWNFSQ